MCDCVRCMNMWENVLVTCLVKVVTKLTVRLKEKENKKGKKKKKLFPVGHMHLVLASKLSHLIFYCEIKMNKNPYENPEKSKIL